VTFRILDPWGLFNRYLLIRHLCTLVRIVLSILVSRVTGSILPHTAASAAVDAQVLQARVLVGLLGPAIAAS